MRTMSCGTPAAQLLRVVELAVRRRRRVDDERARVADVGEVAHELRRLDEADARGEAALARRRRAAPTRPARRRRARICRAASACCGCSGRPG